MVTTVFKKKGLTYEDYSKTPDDKRCELIDGELLMTPSPIPYHQWISKNVLYEMEKFVRENKIGGVFGAPCDVHLDDENILQPDILFIAKERLNIIGEKNIQGAPDLVVEVLSESTAYRDLVKKKRVYAKFGVKEYWIVDPDEKIAEIFTLREGEFTSTKKYSEKDTLESPLLAGLKIKLADVFAF